MTSNTSGYQPGCSNAETCRLSLLLFPTMTSMEQRLKDLKTCAFWENFQAQNFPNHKKKQTLKTKRGFFRIILPRPSTYGWYSMSHGSRIYINQPVSWKLTRSFLIAHVVQVGFGDLKNIILMILLLSRHWPCMKQNHTIWVHPTFHNFSPRDCFKTSTSNNINNFPQDSFAIPQVYICSVSPTQTTKGIFS